MIKLLMSWDIRPGRETSYLDFVSQQFTPGLMRLGLEPSEVWYTYWGEGPQILMGFVAQDREVMKQSLQNPQWTELYQQLDEHVLNFHSKLLPAAGRFQL
ncbi:MAG: hypothetical protein H0T73_06260 [Ardenticatenales bacterium]|nr:hypothetical protein [Ardenticatenales bacterium]